MPALPLQWPAYGEAFSNKRFSGERRMNPAEETGHPPGNDYSKRMYCGGCPCGFKC